MTEQFPPAPARPHLSALTEHQVRARLADHEAWADLGFYPEDLAELGPTIASLDHGDIEALTDGTGRVFDLIGAHLGPRPKDFFDFLPDLPGRPRGLLPMLTLAITAPEVVDYGRRLGLPEDLATSGVRDLGQQVHVHRLVFDELGLHAQWWLTVAWSGTFWWLGRLQFNVAAYDGRFWLSTHIPQTGPLTGVDSSLARASEFARTHLADLGLEVAGFHCDSWLLDPHLIEALGGRGNISAFQRLWTIQPGARVADGDAVFFTFRTREEVTPQLMARLPQRTSLERAVASRLRGGGHWECRVGVMPLT